MSPIKPSHEPAALLGAPASEAHAVDRSSLAGPDELPLAAVVVNAVVGEARPRTRVSTAIASSKVDIGEG